MGSFKSSAVTWWQVILLKVSVIVLGVLIGSTFHDFFGRWIVVVWAVFLLTAACLAYFWYLEAVRRRRQVLAERVAYLLWKVADVDESLDDLA
jgi:hypothetical protein